MARPRRRYRQTVETTLPLRVRTPAGWAAEVLADPLALLDDHAHLEQAAAANALALVRRRPNAVPGDRWVERRTSIARDEVAHLSLVNRELARRGGQLSRRHRNPYAAALRDHARSGDARWDLIDRLMVSALIELRSYERFTLLGAADHELAPLYAGLASSEEGHYRVFVQLAQAAGTDLDVADRVADRWDRWLTIEADVIAAQRPGPRMHSGW